MTSMRSSAIVLARFLLSAVFLASGVNKLFHWRETETQLMGVLSDWQSYLSFSETAQSFFTSVILFTPVLLIIATALELFGGLLVLLGIKEKTGAALLLIMLVPATLLYHQFWFVESAAKELQQVMFLKNLAIMGGLIMVLLQSADSAARREGGYPGGFQ
ncbi:MAG TPA: DoxX family protein [Chlamydiales bacterium]|nr:DoxX family protein [Chlamydiales bacterium]